MSTVKERLDLVRKQTGCTKASAFAKWIGANSPQAVGRWEARDSISSDGALKVHEATGASVKWLLRGEGEPFPDGPTLFAGAAPPELAERVQDAEDVLDGVQVVMTTMLEAMARAMPDAAPGFLAALQHAAARVPDSQRPVLDVAVAAMAAGLQPAAQGGRRASPALSGKSAR